MVRAQRSSRIPGVDIGRFVAALGVIWIHAPNDPSVPTNVARWAVPFFTATASLFAVVGYCPSFPRWLHERIARIYWPFLMWNVIYLVAKSLSNAVRGIPFTPPTLPSIVYDGVAHHLWFLPFICALTICLKLAALLMRNDERRLGYTLLLLACVLLGIDRSYITLLNDHYAASLAWDNLPAGLFMGGLLLISSYDRLVAASRKNALVTWVVFLSGIAILGIFGRHRVVETLTGIFAVAAFTSLQIKETARRWPLGEYAFTVYVVHVLFLEAFQKVLEALASPPALALALWSFCFATFMSIATAIAIKRVAYLRFLVPG